MGMGQQKMIARAFFLEQLVSQSPNPGTGIYDDDVT
jgi:hypothetical protein